MTVRWSFENNYNSFLGFFGGEKCSSNLNIFI